MNCPYCNYHDSRVIDSRDVNDGIRRRRQCLECDSRFTTYERLQPVNLFVIKKDQRREEFNRDKLLSGIRKACEKRPLPTGTADKVADDIEAGLFGSGRAEIPTTGIGDMVMERLQALDHIAYIRFASVHRDFADEDDFSRAVEGLQREGETAAGQLSLLPPQQATKPARRGRPAKQ